MNISGAALKAVCFGRCAGYHRGWFAKGRPMPMRIEHFALNVAKPAEMAQWYARNLGMKIVR